MNQGRPRVLIVEDNLLIAMEVEFLAEKCGCAVAGPVGSVGEALQVVRESRLDGAVLDINLGAERVWPVAELLEERAVPFVLATGYDATDVPERFKARPILAKPISLRALTLALREIGTMRRQSAVSSK